MIYKYVWTPTVLPWEYDREAQCEGQPVRDHIKQLHVLVSVCRHMRYEIIAEYFPHVQAHVLYAAGGHPGPSDSRLGDIRVFTAMRYIKTSPLFRDHLQHVRLTWLPGNLWHHWTFWYEMVARGRQTFAMREARARFGSLHEPFGLGYVMSGRGMREINALLRQPDNFKWLRSLKSLKTLEIIFLDAPRFYPMDRARIPLYNTAEWHNFNKLPNLERVSLRAWSSRQERWKEMQGGKQMDEALKRLLKDPEAGLEVRSRYNAIQCSLEGRPD